MKNNLRRIKRKISKQLFKPEIERFPVAPYTTIDLVYWRPKGAVNFGDELGRTIVELMLARKGITIFDEVSTPRRLVTVGSVLDHAENDSVVWGTGRNGSKPDRAHFFERLDVRAVRGPRTRKFLSERGLNVPEIYGDPALLLPALAGGRFKPTGVMDVLFVPNLNDYQGNIDFSKAKVPILDPRNSWNRAVEAILRAKFIVASSLHALIIAEAYGIPARYVRLTEHENLFKYQDYFEGTGRNLGEFATSIEQAVAMGGKELPDFNSTQLMESFPYDLWA